MPNWPIGVYRQVAVMGEDGMNCFARNAASIAFVALAATGAAIAAEPASGSRPVAVTALSQGRASWATADNDLGEVEDSLPLSHLTVVLKRSPGQQQAFEEFLRQQQDPGSPKFHHWLTPVEVGEQFGASAQDIEAVTSWLQEQGLRVDGVANSRVRIVFSGPAASVGAAFASRLHTYLVDGESRISPAGVPQIPAALSAVVQAVHGLQSMHERSDQRSGVEQVRTFPGDRTKGTSCTGGVCTHFIWPNDFAAIYDVNPVFQQGINGAGQTIAIIGRANVYLPDIENFQARSGLAVKDPVTIIPPGGIDPGPAVSSGGTTPGDQREATLDVTRAGSLAPGATIALIVSAASTNVGGLSIASEYAVDANPVPARIMSISFGACEQSAGQSSVAFYDSLFSQAAAEGISVFVSSGDAGAAGCDTAFATPPASQVASPNYICSSSYATCVGGTEFADSANPNAYWRTTDTTGHESALGYIPEGAWNDPQDSSGNPVATGTGGGISTFIATPTWQTGLGVPGSQGRLTPDVSFSASVHDAYVKCQAASGGDCVPDSSGSFHFITSGGTSAAAPSMAGIAALLNQKMGAAQGNLNPRLYALAASPGNGVFHDITAATSGVSGCDVTVPSMCNNSTPGPVDQTGGLTGFSVGPGYDLATGLGSIDVANLLAHWTSASSSAAFNYQGLWWAAPAGSESGWGINFAHQGDTIFASWFTYDLAGTGNWLVMTAPKTAPGTYSGTLFATSGPPFNAAPFNPSQVTAIAAGVGTLTFGDANDGSFAYTVGSTSQTKAITRQVFGTLPTCATATAGLAAATNYTDLWWASPPGSEAGWGINLTHEGTTIFATWFTYDATGKAMWLVATALQSGVNAYSGTLLRTTGPPFSAVPFNPASVVATPVGNATFTFSDGNNATFGYTVNGISQVKAITRELFSGNGTVCH
jgi:pseudomonalisin